MMVSMACIGIGRSINAISEIEQLQRPLTMEEGGIVLMDLLWSDPTTNDAVEGVQPSPRGPGLVTFGPDRVKEFCRVRCPLSPPPLGGRAGTRRLGKLRIVYCSTQQASASLGGALTQGIVD